MADVDDTTIAPSRRPYDDATLALYRAFRELDHECDLMAYEINDIGEILDQRHGKRGAEASEARKQDPDAHHSAKIDGRYQRMVEATCHIESAVMEMEPFTAHGVLAQVRLAQRKLPADAEEHQPDEVHFPRVALASAERFLSKLAPDLEGAGKAPLALTSGPQGVDLVLIARCQRLLELHQVQCAIEGEWHSKREGATEADHNDQETRLKQAGDAWEHELDEILLTDPPRTPAGLLAKAQAVRNAIADFATTADKRGVVVGEKHERIAHSLCDDVIRLGGAI